MRDAFGCRLLALAVSGSCLLSAVVGTPLNPAHQQISREPHAAHNAEPLTKSKRQQTAGEALAVTGMDHDTVQPRLEIRDLAKNEFQWNLFLLAMQKFQQTDQADRSSWYSVAGIHGKPYEVWDGVESKGRKDSGYCMHSSNLFLPWHRPYLALYEQTLQGLMSEIAGEWDGSPENDNYTEAANTFRLPYWDWAVLPPDGEKSVPSFLSSPTIDVTLPNGTETIDNPLYSYKYHPLHGDDLYDSGVTQFSVYPETMRYPPTKEASAQSQEDQFVSTMDKSRPQLRDALYDLFTNYHNFTIFGNMASYKPGQFQSVEAIHGWVHIWAGGNNGNMYHVPWSSFDPVFMLHHCNIDRIFAMWQVLNPDSYVEPWAQAYGTYMVNSGDVLDADSELYPFHANTNGDFWTAAKVRDVKTFSYTYPDLVNADQAAVRTTINKLYGQSTVSHRTKRADVEDAVDDVADGVTDIINKLVQPGQIDADAAAKDERRYEYTANIKLSKCALGGPGVIYLFIGNFSDSPADWMTDDHLAGSSPLFVMDDSAMGAGESQDIYAAVSLTREIEQRVASEDLGCMDPSEVVPYLKENLQWRVQKADGSSVPADQVEGLEISIAKAAYRPAASDCEFPSLVGVIDTLSEITSGKAGGLAAVGSLLGATGDEE
ncbi:tyrosinase [Diplodia corticola]|uniref:tyrosinase n=1 Tax=Diplodia corticola TaxID=236234 RepID=A0A1J9R915_9PEZI|nr:tyrosinase [Diplodia corticola]OJD37056.1 tyrosinase [Diplodia corticola]